MMMLFLLPTILYPFYLHEEHPMVLHVPSSSILADYLSPGDVIRSLDGKYIHNEQEWLKTTAFMDEQTLSDKPTGVFATTYARKGYCVPTSLLNNRKKNYVKSEPSCPGDLSEFVVVPCFDASRLGNSSFVDDHLVRKDNSYCLHGNDVVQLTKCGYGWLLEKTFERSCLCSKDEACLSPVQLPGLIWAEITYGRPYLPECLQPTKDLVLDSNIIHNEEHNCSGTFVFVGDILSVANSISLTSYRPRWGFGPSAYIPRILEKIIMFTVNVSLTLALLNSMPVYFLDGECMLEVILGHFTYVDSRKTARVLQVCLVGGTLITVLAFTRIFIMAL